MGRYIDWSHVIGRYKEASGVAEASAMQSHWIAAAEAEVDGRLAPRYTVPFTNSPTPVLVQDLCIDLTYVKLTIARKKKKELQDSLKERLEGLVNGTILITDANGPIGPQSNIAWAENSYHSAFGMDNAVNWVVSSESQLDIQNERGQFNGFFGY